MSSLEKSMIFQLHPPGITVKVIAMDCGGHGSHAITTTVGHCRQNMFFLWQHNRVNRIGFKNFSSLYHYYKYICNYFNRTFCKFFKHKFFVLSVTGCKRQSWNFLYIWWSLYAVIYGRWFTRWCSIGWNPMFPFKNMSMKLIILHHQQPQLNQHLLPPHAVV